MENFIFSQSLVEKELAKKDTISVVHHVNACDQLKDFFNGLTEPPNCSICDKYDCNYRCLPPAA